MDFSDFSTGRPTGAGGGGGGVTARELFSTGSRRGGPRWWERFWGSSGTSEDLSGADYEIRQGSRKAVLVSLAVEAWKKERFDARAELKEARGREIGDEDHLMRVLSRTNAQEIEVVVENAVHEGETVRVEGRLKGSARTALDKMGLKIEERVVHEERYLDMTPAIFILGGVLLAARFLALGMDNQYMYILAGLGFAILYGLRPFIYKMQRPREDV